MEFRLEGLTLPVRIQPVRPMTDEELMRFSSQNDLLSIEQDKNGDLIVMSPTGHDGAEQNAEVVYELMAWNREVGRGSVTDSNGGYRLPDGSVRAPDAAWVAGDRLRGISREQRRQFLPLSPDFVIELRSPSDPLAFLREKMEMWMQNGVELAWLIDPMERAVTIYRAGREPERLHTISQVAEEGPVAGFVLPLDRIFND